jgi:two-component system phosphate regulon sensor histidine kinase PhoR
MWITRRLARFSAVCALLALAAGGGILATLTAAGVDSPAVQWGSAAIAAAAVLLLAVATYPAHLRTLRDLEALQRAARAMADGEPATTLPGGFSSSVAPLADALQRLRERLQSQVAHSTQRGEQLATVLASMSEGVLAVDRRLQVLFANPAALRLLKLSDQRALGRPLWELVRKPALERTVRAALAGETPAECDVEFDSGGRKPRTLALHVGRLPGDPCPGLVLVFRDVTELRRLESMRQEFVANVSHELKTPLTAIKAYAETLREGALHDPEHNLAFVARIEQQASRLEHLILDLLNLARIESGQQRFEIRSLPLAVLLPEWVQQHAAAAAAGELQLQVQPPAEDVRAVADEEGLRQIVDNLLNNAVKYTPPGGRVTVAWRYESGQCVLEVSDTGIGIAPEEQQRIFERFYRVDRARSREQGGTGLGLAIVKHLVQSFAGQIRVASALGKGSTFTVLLPGELATPAGAAPRSPPADAPHRPAEVPQFPADAPPQRPGGRAS